MVLYKMYLNVLVVCKSSRQFVSFGSAGVWCTSHPPMFSRQREDGPPWLMRFRTTWAWGTMSFKISSWSTGGTLEFGWIWMWSVWDDFMLFHPNTQVFLKSHTSESAFQSSVNRLSVFDCLGCQDRTTGNKSQPGHVSLSSHWVACNVCNVLANSISIHYVQ